MSGQYNHNVLATCSQCVRMLLKVRMCKHYQRTRIIIHSHVTAYQSSKFQSTEMMSFALRSGNQALYIIKGMTLHYSICVNPHLVPHSFSLLGTHITWSHETGSNLTCGTDFRFFIITVLQTVDVIVANVGHGNASVASFAWEWLLGGGAWVSDCK